ncbi:hypothetical protein GN956_G14026 [Arapaima gigas]
MQQDKLLQTQSLPSSHSWATRDIQERSCHHSLRCDIRKQRVSLRHLAESKRSAVTRQRTLAGRFSSSRYSRGEAVLPVLQRSLGCETVLELTKQPSNQLTKQQTRTMKTRLGCLSHKSDSYSDFSAFLSPEKSTRCLKLTTDEVVRWAESFDTLLSHKYGLAAFRAFLKTEFSDENIEFWMACEDYKKIKSPAKMAAKANKIFEEFIDVHAPREVNIDFQTREMTRQKLQEPNPSSFSDVQGRVYSLMEKDSYPRFLRSKIYLDILNNAQTPCQRRSV